MTKTQLAAIGLAFALLLAWATTCILDESLATSMPDGKPTELAASAPGSIATGDPADHKALERELIETEHRRLLALAPHEFALEIHTRDTHDIPAGEVPILLAPDLHPLNQTSTGDDGVLRIKWRGRTDRMCIVYTSSRDLSGGRRLRRIDVRDGVTAKVILRTKGQTATRIISGGTVSKISYTVFRPIHITVNPTVSTILPDLPLKLHTDSEGWSWFTDGSTRAGVEAGGKPVHATNFDISTRLVGNIVWSVPRESGTEAGRCRIQGQVRDARGLPVPNALILVAATPKPTARFLARGKTDEKGRFDIAVPNRDEYVIRAGGGDLGLARSTLLYRGEPVIEWNATLDRGLEFLGRLEDNAGAPLARWRIELRPMDGALWIDGTTTDKNGRFSIPNVENRPYRVLMIPPAGSIAVARGEFLRAGVEHALQVPHGVAQLGKFTAKVMDREELRPSHSAGARLWNDSLGEGLRVAGIHKPSGVPAGLHRLEIGSRAFGWHPLSTVQIAANSTTDLNEVLLAPPTLIDRKAPEAPTYRFHTAVLSLVRTDADKVWIAPGKFR